MKVSNSEERLANAFVQGLVQSAIARGIDPVARPQQFRTLQQVAFTMSQDPAVAQTSEQLVQAIDLALIELIDVKEQDGLGVRPLVGERLG